MVILGMVTRNREWDSDPTRRNFSIEGLDLIPDKDRVPVETLPPVGSLVKADVSSAWQADKKRFLFFLNGIREANLS